MLLCLLHLELDCALEVLSAVKSGKHAVGFGLCLRLVAGCGCNRIALGLGGSKFLFVGGDRGVGFVNIDQPLYADSIAPCSQAK